MPDLLRRPSVGGDRGPRRPARRGDLHPERPAPGCRRSLRGAWLAPRARQRRGAVGMGDPLGRPPTRGAPRRYRHEPAGPARAGRARSRGRSADRGGRDRFAAEPLRQRREAEDPVNARQIADFARVRAAYPGIRASLANSSGVFLDGAQHDLLRPGYALFGGNPTPAAANPMRPVVRLEALIAQVRAVEAGATAGYNGRWTAARPSRLATLSLGYADGFPGQSAGGARRWSTACPARSLASSRWT